MIEFKNVSFDYDGDAILKNINFNITNGDFVAVLGANGAGKTTLSKLFNGLLQPTAGDVVVDGMNTKSVKTSVLARHIGFLFQNPDRQICCNTIREEILFGLECVNSDKKYCNERCEEILSVFGFDGDKNPFMLSRGERQKVALASVIAVKPKILLLDEPTTGLDYNECMQMMSVIRDLNQSGTTVVMITHDMEIVLDFAKTVLVLSKGQLKTCAEMRETMKNAPILAEAKLLPPQIAELAMRLGRDFDSVYTVEEMTAQIAKGGYLHERIS